jgi:hypothetical protein
MAAIGEPLEEIHIPEPAHVPDAPAPAKEPATASRHDHMAGLR